MIVGVDIDGVLANQIEGVLPRIKRRLGINLGYEDITHFRLPLGDSDVAVEILDAMTSPDYLLSMPVHDGAHELLQWLAERHTVKLITARPATAIGPTRQWLAQNDLPYHELVAATEALKSRHGTDVLIDDYVGNLAEFLERSDGVGIVLEQPWNTDRSELLAWLQNGRLLLAENLPAVQRLIEMLQESYGSRSLPRPARVRS
jgi:uncharacterized HAD superfamily protein